MTDTAGGALIVFEGGDGAGKSTQAAALVRALGERGYMVERTREPGGTDLAEALRALVLDPANAPIAANTEALLFAAARADHVARRIRPALAAGHIVVCDRFVDSSIAYQGAGRELGVDRVAELNEWALHGLRPDLTVVLDVDETTARQRLRGRGLDPDRLERETAHAHATVAETFRVLAAREPERYLVLPAQWPAEQLAAAILDRVEEVLA